MERGDWLPRRRHLEDTRSVAPGGKRKVKNVKDLKPKGTEH